LKANPAFSPSPRPQYIFYLIQLRARPAGLAHYTSDEGTHMTLSAQHKLVSRLWAEDSGNHPVVLSENNAAEPSQRGSRHY